MDIEANDLASMADTVASNVGTVHSDATPSTPNITTHGSSQLAPIDIDANDLASMEDTVHASVESSSYSSIDFSISEGHPEGYFADFNCMFYCLATTSAAPLEDMVTELPEEDPILSQMMLICLTTLLHYSCLLETSNRP